MVNVEALVGRTLGQYKLQKLIGSGGMGAVYYGKQINLGRSVAIKVLSGKLTVNPDYVARFNREARIAASLEHPHIVPIYDHGNEGEINYVVMRLLTEGSLSNRLTDKRTVPSIKQSITLLKQLASALDYAHSRGVIHRDIKASNVMFDQHNNAFLVDFGIARMMESTTELTGTGMKLGTPSYMPPEQWRGEEVQPASDQYSLGVMAYALIVGRLPFEAPTPHVLLHMHLNEPPPSVREIRSDLDYRLDGVFKRVLDKAPEQRYKSVMEFVTDLEHALDGSQAQAVPVQSRQQLDQTFTQYTKTPPPKPAPRSRGQSWNWAILITGLLLLSLGGGLFYIGGWQPNLDRMPIGSGVVAGASSETPTLTQVPSLTSTPTETDTVTPTNTQTLTQTSTSTTTTTPTASVTVTQAVTDTPTMSRTPTNTPIMTPSVTATRTPTTSRSDDSQSSNVTPPEAVIDVVSANLRLGPGTEYGIARVGYRGDELSILAEARDWYLVERADGVTAWIAASIVTTNLSADATVEPAETIPPPPAPVVSATDTPAPDLVASTPVPDNQTVPGEETNPTSESEAESEGPTPTPTRYMVNGVDCTDFRGTSPVSMIAPGQNTFYWVQAPGAESYWVFVDSSTQGPLDIFHTGGPGNNITISLEFNPGTVGTITWRVEAVKNGSVACTNTVVLNP